MEDLLSIISSKLKAIEPIDTKKMFGGIVFYKDDVIFAAIMENEFMIKAHKANKAFCENLGFEPFRPKGRDMTMPYYLVPDSFIIKETAVLDLCTKAWELEKAIKKKK